MERMSVGAIRFDKKFWPESGTMVPAAAVEGADLNDLWQDHEAQAATFVAEALISDPPKFIVQLQDGSAKIEAFLWEVGGDNLVVDAALGPLIESAIRDYEFIRSESQAADIKRRLASLEHLEVCIGRAKEFGQRQLAEFEG